MLNIDLLIIKIKFLNFLEVQVFDDNIVIENMLLDLLSLYILKLIFLMFCFSLGNHLL